MKLLFSIPTGYHLRELVMPLHHLLDDDAEIEQVICMTPGALHKDVLFSAYGNKFMFVQNPAGDQQHLQKIQELDPAVVVTNTVGHDEKDYPILKAALDLGIPTVTFIASWDNVWKIGRMKKHNIPIMIADTIIVWNVMMKKHLLRMFPDMEQERVRVIGAPRLDYFWHDSKIPSKKEIYSYLGFADVERPLIHFATTELYPMDYVVKAVSDAVRKKKFEVKPYFYASVHPGGDMAKHESLKTYGTHVRYSFGRIENAPIKDFAYNPSETNMYNLVGVFKYADVLINHSSTTALESLIARTPVINVKYGKPLDWWRWHRSMVYRDFKEHYRDIIRTGATYVVKSKKQLIDAIRMAMNDPQAKKKARLKTVKRMITTTDGTAGQKVLKVIKSNASH